MPVVWLLSFCCFTMGCSGQFITGIPSVIAESCGIGLPEVGLFMTVFGYCSAIGAPIMLVLTSKFTQRQQMVLGLSIMTAMLFVFSCSSFYPLLLATRGVMAVGNGMFTATAIAISASLAKPGHEASAMANVTMGFSASQVLAMPIARAAVPYMDWHVLYLILAFIGLISAITIWRSVPSSEPAMAGVGLRERLTPLRDRRVACAMAVVILLSVGFSSFYTYITPFLETVFEHDFVGFVLFIAGLMCVVGSKGSGILTDHAGFKTTIILALAMQTVSLFTLGVGGLAVVAPLVFIFICTYNIADWGFMPSQNLLLTKLVPKTSAMAIALSGSSLQLGNATGSALGSGILLFAPLQVLPFVACGFAAVAFAIELYVVREATKAMKANETAGE